MPHQTQFTPVSCRVLSTISDSVLALFEEGEDNEQELWVPHSALDPDDLDVHSSDNDWDEVVELNIAIWWLIRNSIGY